MRSILLPWGPGRWFATRPSSTGLGGLGCPRQLIWPMGCTGGAAQLKGARRPITGQSVWRGWSWDWAGAENGHLPHLKR